MVKRFGIETTKRCDGGIWLEVVEDTMGDWVLHDDHEEIVDRLLALVSDLAEHISTLAPDSSWWVDHLSGRVDSEARGDKQCLATGPPDPDPSNGYGFDRDF